MRTLCIALLGLAAACGNAASPEEVRQGLVDLPVLLADLGETSDAVTTSATAGRFDDDMNALNGAFGSMPIRFPTVSTTTTTFKLPATDGDVESGLRAIVDKIFTEANHEGDGVFRVHGDVLCDADEPDYADCVAKVEALEIRIRAERDGDTIELTLLIGPERAAPLSLAASHDTLAVTVDLAGTRAALVHTSTVTGETFELPDTMAGQISVSLHRHGRLDWTAALSVPQAIDVTGHVSEGPVAIHVDARDPMLSLRANGVRRELTATVDIGPVALTAPWKAVSPESLAVGTFHLDWRGLTGRVTLADGQSTLTFEDISLGDGTSSFKLDDVTLLSLALNAESGRSVDVTFAPSASGLPTIAFSPGFVLDVGLDLGPLAAAGDTVEPWAIDERYHISLGTEIQPVAPIGDFPGGLRAVSGGIEVAALNAGQSVAVPAGQCLVEDLVTDGEHPIIGALAARACP